MALREIIYWGLFISQLLFSTANAGTHIVDVFIDYLFWNKLACVMYIMMFM